MVGVDRLSLERFHFRKTPLVTASGHERLGLNARGPVKKPATVPARALWKMNESGDRGGTRQFKIYP